jgi:acetyl-CoA C-acetyltransferase
MADVLRADPGSLGLVTGVGMHMTKHVYGLYSTEPGPVSPPEPARVQSELEAAYPARPLVVNHEGDATVAAYSVVHGRDGGPESGIAVCDVTGDGGARVYARFTDAELLAAAEETELVGRRLRLTPATVTLPTGAEAVANHATLA